jgi:hypothetical protein
MQKGVAKIQPKVYQVILKMKKRSWPQFGTAAETGSQRLLTSQPLFV